MDYIVIEHPDTEYMRSILSKKVEGSLKSFTNEKYIMIKSNDIVIAMGRVVKPVRGELNEGEDKCIYDAKWVNPLFKFIEPILDKEIKKINKKCKLINRY